MTHQNKTILLGKDSAFAETHSPAGSFESPVQKTIGETPAVLELKNNIQKVAYLDCTVLIIGETGTGKKLAARCIHMLSPRKAGKFMAVNCGSFSEELLVNELFGHEADAFPGALHSKQGIFEAAPGGTMLLDEIDEMPLSLQVRLLDVLQQRTLVRVGGINETPVDVRVLAATNHELQESVENGEFCEGLYYRLNAFVLRIPPLRKRKEDIPLLSSYFLDKYRKAYGKEITGISNEVLHSLMKYPFRGNVRELESAIERAVIMCDEEELRNAHLPRRFIDARETAGTEEKELVSLAELEKQYIKEVLRATGGNKSRAAKILGINRASLWRKLKEMKPEP